MARTPSTMLKLGTPAPDFALPDTSGETTRLADFAEAPALLVMFICNHCPFVIHVRDELAAIGREYGAKGVGIVAINSNDVENYPDDSPAKMARVNPSTWTVQVNSILMMIGTRDRRTTPLQRLLKLQRSD